MKNKLLIPLSFSVFIFSCTANNPATNPGPSANPEPSVSASPSPVSSPTVSPSPSVSAEPSASVSPSAVPSPAPTAVPEPATEILLTGDAYLKSPDSAFLVIKPIETEIAFTLSELPQDPEVFTLFGLYDSAASKEHFQVQIDSEKNFIVKLNTLSQSYSETINFPSLQSGIEYKLSFIRENNQIRLMINDSSVLEKTVEESDFANNNGRRFLTIGAAADGTDKFIGSIDYFKVKDLLSYQFNNNLLDSSINKIDAIGSGGYSFIMTGLPEPQPSVSPEPSSTPSASPSPSSSSSPLPSDSELDDKSSSKVSLSFASVDDENKTSFLSDWFDFSTGKTQSSGDFRLQASRISGTRFIDEKFSFTIRTNTVDPRVQIADLGPINFDGLLDLSRVDFEMSQLYSSDPFNTPVYADHVYAIKSYRYGSEPHYAKFYIREKITEKYISEKMTKPVIQTQPQFVSSTSSTSFSDNVNYKYFVSTYDMNGETEATEFNAVSDPSAAGKKVSFSFYLPYRASGYVVYKQYGGNTFRMGPFISPSDQIISFEDTGNLSMSLSSVPTSNTTIKSGYKPDDWERPKGIEFSFKFNGKANKKTFY